MQPDDDELTTWELYASLPWFIFIITLLLVIFADGFLPSAYGETIVTGTPRVILIVGINGVAIVGLLAFLALSRRWQSARLLSLGFFGSILALEVVTMVWAGITHQISTKNALAFITLLVPVIAFIRLLSVPRDVWVPTQPGKSKQSKNH